MFSSSSFSSFIIRNDYKEGTQFLLLLFFMRNTKSRETPASLTPLVYNGLQVLAGIQIPQNTHTISQIRLEMY